MRTVRPTDGMEISESVILEPGSYLLQHGLRIVGDGVTIVGTGVTLVGSNRQYTGISATGTRGVHVVGCALTGYKQGVRVTDSQNFTLENCRAYGTDEIAPNSTFLDIWRGEEDPYGAGVLLVNCSDSSLLNNELQHQQTGVLAYQCNGLNVVGNQCNYNSGAGILINQTCDSIFEQNSCDYCCRFEQREGGLHYGHMGADAAGFVAVNGSCRNKFIRNTARLGGDGFFLTGMNSDGTKNGCNDNLFEQNDASLSPNIAFEATFCERNIYRDNYADRCNFGFWCGYSKEFTIEKNRMLFNRQAGIAVENGIAFDVTGNHFQSSKHGILLWSGGQSEYVESFPYRETCQDWTIHENIFAENWTAIRIGRDMDHGIRKLPPEKQAGISPNNIRITKNDIQGNRTGISLDGVVNSLILENLMSDNIAGNICLTDCEEVRVGHNLGSRGAYV